MAVNRQERVPSFEEGFEEDDGAPTIMPVEPRIDDAGSMTAEVGTEADSEAVRTMAEEAVDPAEVPEPNPPVPEPTEVVVPP